MTHEFKVGDEVWVWAEITQVKASPANSEYVKIKVFDRNVFQFIETKYIKPIETPFLIEGRTYQCRAAGLTSTASKNENGWWVATGNDEVQGTISDKGYFLSLIESPRDLISLLPEVKVCECCGQVVKEKE